MCGEPFIDYCSYLGGATSDHSKYLRVDRSSHRYVVVGRTYALDYPVTDGAYGEVHASYPYHSDATITVFDQGSNEMLASTFLGSVYDDVATCAAIDAESMIYVAGYTNSPGFPVTPGVSDTYYNGSNYEAYVVAISDDLATLKWGTYCGGGMNEKLYDICCDGYGGVYVCGYTESSDMYFTDECVTGGTALVAKYKTSSGIMEWCTAVGVGTGTSLSCADDGRVFVAGVAIGAVALGESAYDTEHDGRTDLFIVELDGESGDCLGGTFLGGSGREVSIDIECGNDGNLYFMAITKSSDFPLSDTGWGSEQSGDTDVVVGCMTESCESLLWARDVGGSGFDGGATASPPPRIVLDDSNNIIALTSTMSDDIRTTSSSISPTLSGEEDALLMSIDRTGAFCNWMTYLGGSSIERGMSVDLNADGIFILGYTGNISDLPVTDDAYDSTLGGSVDAFIMHIADPEIVGVEIGDVSLRQEGGAVYMSWDAAMSLENGAFTAYAVSGLRNRELDVVRRGGTFTATDPDACGYGGGEVAYVVSMRKADGTSVEIFNETISMCCADPLWDMWVTMDGEHGGVVYLKTPVDTTVDIGLYDLRGREIAKSEKVAVYAGMNEYVLGEGMSGVKSLPSGIYLMECVCGDRKMSAKVCLAH